MKRGIIVFLGLFTLSLAYYLIFYPYEFEINFKTKTLPGDLIETIRIWNKSFPDKQPVDVNAYASLQQTMTVNGSVYRFKWNFESVSDSVTHVKIQITEPGHSLKNKLLVPFTHSKIEGDTEEASRKFITILKEHLEITKVKIVGESVLDSVVCLCRQMETKQTDKAYGMMRDYSLLTSFMDSHKLKPNGPPMVRVTEWNHQLGTLKFDFCFPLNDNSEMPPSDSMDYKMFKSIPVLKAEYRGNYITSDRAWYSLLHYAHENGYEVDATPIEYFYDNPNLGLNEANWKAEIFLPLTSHE